MKLPAEHCPKMNQELEVNLQQHYFTRGGKETAEWLMVDVDYTTSHCQVFTIFKGNMSSI